MHGLINEAANQMRMSWYSWNRIEGLKKWNSESKQFDEANEELMPALFDLGTLYEWGISRAFYFDPGGYTP